MTSREILGPLLRSVSRSFYLSIRLLPPRLREPIGLAYLLARASDTIADSGELPSSERRTHLATFATLVQNGGTAGLRGIQSAVRSPHSSENELISRLDEALVALATLDAVERALVRAVLARIIHGQDLDLVHFGDAQHVIALQSAGELEEYTYLVAGCVGEFWTDVCLHHYPKFSRLDSEPLRALAKDFGKALQLVNILRDMPADLKAGRCYLPGNEVDPHAVIDDPKIARECFERWRKRGEELLDAGRRYTISLRLPRLRAACFLPWEIGRRTLALLGQQPPLETQERIKVSRGAVRATLLRAFLAAFSDRPLAS